MGRLTKAGHGEERQGGVLPPPTFPSASFLPLLLQLDLFVYFMSIYGLSAYIYVYRVPSEVGREHWPLDLELGMVVSHHRVLGLELSPFSTVYMSRDNRDLYPFFISSFFKAFVYFLYCICLYFLKFYVYLCFTHICACGPCVFSACDDHKRV